MNLYIILFILLLIYLFVIVLSSYLAQLSPLLLQCWGYLYPYIDINGEILETKVLMYDQRGGKLWAVEKHIKC